MTLETTTDSFIFFKLDVNECDFVGYSGQGGGGGGGSGNDNFNMNRSNFGGGNSGYGGNSGGNYGGGGIWNKSKKFLIKHF